MKPGRFLITVMLITGLGLGLAMSAGAQGLTTHTVQPGDTLWSISHKYYGNRNLWPKLWEINRFNTTNPHQISVGDVLLVPPLDKLMRAQAPPAPPPVKTSLYDAGQPIKNNFPKYFSFLADPNGLGGTGVNRIKVSKIDPQTGKPVVAYTEVREAGEILATMDRGYAFDPSMVTNGKLLLTVYDDVIVRFTEDVARVLDSATHEDPDPYFREFPIYGYGQEIMEPDENRHDNEKILGQLHQFKGVLTVVARVETLVPLYEKERHKLARTTERNSDSEPVSYVARITYAEKPVNIGDHVFLFKDIYPGPDREIDNSKLHEADQYQPPDK
jgi:hypothetical protein